MAVAASSIEQYFILLIEQYLKFILLIEQHLKFTVFHSVD
jgi:hypothetical protein